MSDDLKFQLRLTLTDQCAERAKARATGPLPYPIDGHPEAAPSGVEMPVRCFRGLRPRSRSERCTNYPLYQWTKETIEDPAKEAKYAKSFTLCVDGSEDVQIRHGSGPQPPAAAAQAVRMWVYSRSRRPGAKAPSREHNAGASGSALSPCRVGFGGRRALGHELRKTLPPRFWASPIPPPTQATVTGRSQKKLVSVTIT
jgi:hypothetical protein